MTSTILERIEQIQDKLLEIKELETNSILKIAMFEVVDEWDTLYNEISRTEYFRKATEEKEYIDRVKMAVYRVFSEKVNKGNEEMKALGIRYYFPEFSCFADFINHLTAGNDFCLTEDDSQQLSNYIWGLVARDISRKQGGFSNFLDFSTSKEYPVKTFGGMVRVVKNESTGKFEVVQ